MNSFLESRFHLIDTLPTQEILKLPPSTPPIFHLHLYQPLRYLAVELNGATKTIFDIRGEEKGEGGFNLRIFRNSYTRLLEGGFLTHPYVGFDLFGITADYLNAHHKEFIENLREKVNNGANLPTADPYFHFIFPLIDDIHKRMWFRYGIEDFKRRFGKYPKSMWLPEMAVDLKTLAALAVEFQRIGEELPYIWLRDYQVDSSEKSPAYKISTPEGAVVVIVTNTSLSGSIAFNKPWADNFAGGWARNVQEGICARVAIDGETFGEHWGEDDGAFLFLNWLLNTHLPDYIRNLNLLPNLAINFNDLPTAQVREGTSWSCVDNEGGGPALKRWTGEEGCWCDLPKDNPDLANKIREEKRSLWEKMTLASRRIDNELDSLFQGEVDPTGLPRWCGEYLKWFTSQRENLAWGRPVEVRSLPSNWQIPFVLALLRDVGRQSCAMFFGGGYERQIIINSLTTIAELTGWEDVRP